MQCAMSVSLLLLLTTCVSPFAHISPRGTWAVITLQESLGYVDINCVMSDSKSSLPFVISYDFFGAEDRTCLQCLFLSLICHSLYFMFWVLKIGNSILITCGLLHVYEQTGSVIPC